MNTAELVAFPCMLLFTAVGLVCDVRAQKLPNWLTAPVFCAGLLFHAISRPDSFQLLAGNFLFPRRLWRRLLPAAVAVVCWRRGRWRRKIHGGAGCWLGAWLTFQVLVLERRTSRGCDRHNVAGQKYEEGGLARAVWRTGGDKHVVVVGALLGRLSRLLGDIYVIV